MRTRSYFKKIKQKSRVSSITKSSNQLSPMPNNVLTLHSKKNKNCKTFKLNETVRKNSTSGTLNKSSQKLTCQEYTVMKKNKREPVYNIAKDWYPMKLWQKEALDSSVNRSKRLDVYNMPNNDLDLLPSENCPMKKKLKRDINKKKMVKWKWDPFRFPSPHPFDIRKKKSVMPKETLSLPQTNASLSDIYGNAQQQIDAFTAPNIFERLLSPLDAAKIAKENNVTLKKKEGNGDHRNLSKIAKENNVTLKKKEGNGDHHNLPKIAKENNVTLKKKEGNGDQRNLPKIAKENNVTLKKKEGNGDHRNLPKIAKGNNVTLKKKEGNGDSRNLWDNLYELEASLSMPTMISTLQAVDKTCNILVPHKNVVRKIFPSFVRENMLKTEVLSRKKEGPCDCKIIPCEAPPKVLPESNAAQMNMEGIPQHAPLVETEEDESHCEVVSVVNKDDRQYEVIHIADDEDHISSANKKKASSSKKEAGDFFLQPKAPNKKANMEGIPQHAPLVETEEEESHCEVVSVVNKDDRQYEVIHIADDEDHIPSANKKKASSCKKEAGDFFLQPKAPNKKVNMEGIPQHKPLVEIEEDESHCEIISVVNKDDRQYEVIHIADDEDHIPSANKKKTRSDRLFQQMIEHFAELDSMERCIK